MYLQPKSAKGAARTAGPIKERFAPHSVLREFLGSAKGAALLAAQAGFAAIFLFQGCAAAPGRPAQSKELKMQSPPDAKNPQKRRPPIPEMVGATSAPFKLEKGITTVSFEIHAPTGPGLLRSDGQPGRVLLSLENVTAKLAAPSFGIYLNLPPGSDPERHPELYAMTLSTFGLVESSKTSEEHPGDGLNFRKDVTDLFLRLMAVREWDHRTLHVSFAPIRWKDYPLDVRVGRVSLMLE